MKRPEDKNIHTFVKIIMTAIFLWSGFFWGGVSIINFYFISKDDAHLATPFLIGSILLLVSLILCWLRLYVFQLVPCVIGLIVYLQPVKEMIDHVAGRGIYFKPTFEVRYLPVIGFAVLSLILFAVRAWTLISTRIEQRDKFNNSPAESILEKRHDE